MVDVVLVPGTASWSGLGTSGRWYQEGSSFVAFLESLNIRVVSKRRPFVWSTELNGVFPWNRHRDWEAGGVNLYAYLDPAIQTYGVQLPYGDRNVIAHSHGLQVALYAAAAGCKINTLISVSGPIRKDMGEVALAARRNIRHWVHVAGGWRDRFQWLGELFDGHLGIERKAIWWKDGKVSVAADESVIIPSLGHSDLLCTPGDFHYWQDRHLLDYLTLPVGV